MCRQSLGFTHLCSSLTATLLVHYSCSPHSLVVLSLLLVLFSLTATLFSLTVCSLLTDPPLLFLTLTITLQMPTYSSHSPLSSHSLLLFALIIILHFHCYSCQLLSSLIITPLLTYHYSSLSHYITLLTHHYSFA